MAKQSLSVKTLNESVIAETALRIIEEEEPEALTFRRLGQALNVSHMTVHRRCGDLAGLLDLCVDHLAGQLPQIAPGTAWPEGTAARFTALYEVMVRHPGLVVLRRGRPWVGPKVLARLTEPQLAANRAVGMDAEESIRAYRRLYLFTLGCAAFVDHANPQAAATRTRISIAALDPERYPQLSGTLPAVIAAMSDHEVFHGGLRQMIAAADPVTR